MGRLGLLGLLVAGSVAASLVIARDCDAPDVLQLLMLLVFPPLAGVAAGAAIVLARPSTERRAFAAVAAGVLVAVGTLLLTLIVWLAGCSA